MLLTATTGLNIFIIKPALQFVTTAQEPNIHLDLLMQTLYQSYHNGIKKGEMIDGNITKH